MNTIHYTLAQVVSGEALRQIFDAVAEPVRGTYSDSLVDKALDRLAAGDVFEHREYGWGVKCRDEFGDDRAEAECYWPHFQVGEYSDRWVCKCRYYTQGGELMCSHILAVCIFQAAKRGAK